MGLKKLRDKAKEHQEKVGEKVCTYVYIYLIKEIIFEEFNLHIVVHLT